MYRRHLSVLAALSLALLGVVTPAMADTAMHARVSYEAGGAMVKGTGDTDWSYATVNTLVLPGDTVWADTGALAEVEMSGGTFLRLADKSKAEVVSLPPSGVLRGWTGSFYIQRVSRSTGDFVFQAPACSIAIDRDSHVRVDIVESGATTVSVRWGRATVRTDVGSPVAVGTAKRVYIDPGYLPSVPQGFDAGVEDDFDAWSRERARVMALGTDAIPKAARTTSTSSYEPIGTADLTNYGEWVYVDNEPYWRPTVIVNYVPYRYGCWSYVPRYGYCWVDDYPFAYTTSHYGRWSYNNSYGWLWTYRGEWGPAWVASVRVGSNFVWSPLDPFDRPIYFGSGYYGHTSYGTYYDFGPFRFSSFATSYCPVDSLFYGYTYARPARPGSINVVNGDVYVWNININNSNINIPWAGNLPIREYSPRRVLRGPDQIDRGSRTVRAIDRIDALEMTAGRGQFRAVDRTGVRQQRTTATRSADREAGVRRVTAAAARQDEGRPLSQRLTRDVRGPVDDTESGDRPDRATRAARTPDDNVGVGGDRATASRTTRSRDASDDAVDRTGRDRSLRTIDRGDADVPSRGNRNEQETASRDMRTRVPEDNSAVVDEGRGRTVRNVERETPDRSDNSERTISHEPRRIELPDRSGNDGGNGVDRGNGRVDRTPDRSDSSRPIDRTPDRGQDSPRTIDRTPDRGQDTPRTVERTPDRSSESPRSSDRSDSSDDKRSGRSVGRSSVVTPQRTEVQSAPRTVTLRGGEGRGNSQQRSAAVTPDGGRVRTETPRTSGRSLAERTMAPESATTPQERVMSAPRISLPNTYEPRSASVTPRSAQRSPEPVSVSPRSVQLRETAPRVSEPRVSAPQRNIEMPQRQIQMPERQVQAPQRQIQMPERQIQMPERQIEMPRREIQMPQREIQMPQRQIEMPSRGSSGVDLGSRGSRSVDSGRSAGHRGR